jgi:HEAT repeat protein
MVVQEKIQTPESLSGSKFCKLSEQHNTVKLLYGLGKLGHLPQNFQGDWLIPLLNHRDDRIRYLAVKNIGKLASDSYLESLIPVAKDDKDSKVRREAVSAIGRMRSRKALPFLVDMTKDIDPKVVLC